MARNVDCYIGLGSNLGARASMIKRAMQLISQQIGKLTAKSFLYESEPWGTYHGQTFPYVNAAILLNTTKSADEVLAALQHIENELGRERTTKNAPRTIDLDLLYHGRQIITTDHLKVPHPHLPARRFVLQPLNDINPFFIHPTVGLSSQQLLEACPDSKQALFRV